MMYPEYLYRTGQPDKLQQHLAGIIALCRQHDATLKADASAKRDRSHLRQLAQAARVAQADYYLREGQLEQALASIQQVLAAAQPDDVTNAKSQALQLQAQVLLQQGQPQAALAAAQQAVSASPWAQFSALPANPELTLLMARAQLALGRDGECQASARAIRQAQAYYPGFKAPAWAYKLAQLEGQRLARSGRLQPALKAYRRAFAMLTREGWQETSGLSH